MIDDALLNSLLEASAQKALDKIKQNQAMTAEEAMPLLLKAQFNHIAHLDVEISALRTLMDKRFEQVDKRFEQVDKRFEQVDKRFEQVDKRFEQVEKQVTRVLTVVGLGIGFLSLLMALFRFV